MATGRQIGRDFLVSMSLANLVLLEDWRILFGGSSYFAAPQSDRFYAVTICSLLLSVVFLCASQVARRRGRIGQTVARWLFLQLIVVSTCSLVVPSFSVLFSGYIAIAALPLIAMEAVIILAPLALASNPIFVRWLSTFLMVVTPCIALLLIRATYEVSHVRPQQAVVGNIAKLSTDGPKALLVVFDEMSEYVAFTNRPQGIEMPAFDRLRGESFVAANAYPPAGETLISMPAILTGREIQQSQPVSERELSLKYAQDQNEEPFGASPTIFSEISSRGLGTAMIGWYHPYCSVLQELDYCVHVIADRKDRRYERGGLFDKVLDVFAALPFMEDSTWALERFGKAARESQQYEVALVSKTARRALAEFRSGLLVLHFPIPHPPTLDGTGLYFSNLAATDNELQELRRIMEGAGTWDETLVLITSDHWWRTHAVWRNQDWARLPSFTWTKTEAGYIDADQDKRVPFIAKLPGQNRSVTYTEEFNTILLHKIILRTLDGEIKTHDELKTWLDVHRNDVAVHAYANVVSH